MNILVAVDENYADPLQVMLQSLFMSHKDVEITVYLLHSGLSCEKPVIVLV